MITFHFMNRMVLTLVMAVAAWGGVAQADLIAPRWTHRVAEAEPASQVIGRFIAFGPEHSVVVAFEVESATRFGGAVCKYDGSGHLVWERRFPNPGKLFANQPLALALDGQGNAYFLCQAGLSKLAAANGATVWEKTTADFNVTLLYSAVLAADGAGNVAMAYPVAPEGEASVQTDIYTVKLAAADGAQIWVQRFDGVEQRNDTPEAMAIDAQGDVIVAGLSNYKAVAVKFAGADGARKWVWYGAGAVAVHLAVGAAGGVAVIGNSNSAPAAQAVKLSGTTGAVLWDVQENTSYGEVALDGAGNVLIAGGRTNASGENAPFVMKRAAATGLPLWKRALSELSDVSISAAQALAVDAAGNAITTQSVIAGWDVDSLDFSTAAFSAEDGAVLWQTSRRSPGEVADKSYALAADADGRVVVSGSSPAYANGYVAVYAAGSGAVVWEQQYQGQGYRADAAAAQTVDGAGNVFLASNDTHYNGVPRFRSVGRLLKYALADGATIWTVATPAFSTISYVGADAVGDVVAAGQKFDADGFPVGSFINKYRGTDGALLWEQAMAGDVVALVLDVTGQPVAQTREFILNTANVVDRLARLSGANGAVQWTREETVVDTDFTFATPAVDAQGNVCAAPGLGRVVKYAAADGHVLWETALKIAGGDGVYRLTLGADAAGNFFISGRDPETNRPLTAKFAGATGGLEWRQSGPPAQEAGDKVKFQAVDAAGDAIVLMVDGRLIKYAGVDGAVRWLHSADVDFWRKLAAMTLTSRGDVVVVSQEKYGEYYASDYRLFTSVYAGADGSLMTQHRDEAGEGSFVNSSFPSDVLVNAGLAGTIVLSSTASINEDADAVTLFFEPANEGPAVTLQGENPVEVESYLKYPETGASAIDPQEGSLQVTYSSFLYQLSDRATPGFYSVDYTATNSRGITGGATRVVHIVKQTVPAISARDLEFEATEGEGAPVTDFGAVTVADGGPFLQLKFDPPAGSVFPVGTTSVLATADDGVGHTGTARFMVTVRDTVPPTIAGPFTMLAFTSSTFPDYRPQAVTHDLTRLELVQTPAPGSAVIPGAQTVTITAADRGGNEAAVSFAVEARLDAVRHTTALREGDPAPGAGTADGPPGGAKLMAFGAPAIDDAGQLAFTARWKKGTRSGAGIFTRERCVALVGRTWRTLEDPVIDAGHVAFLATPAGGPKSAAGAVYSDAPHGTLEMIAQAGEDAPGIDGARFQSFQAVGIAGSAVAFKATASGKHGAPVTGVWAGDETHASRALLYEGQTVGGHTIGRLEAFTAARDAPGQGRGWLLTVGGQARVQARAIFRDGVQLLLSTTFDETPQVVAQTGMGYGFIKTPFDPTGPRINTAEARGFGLPAWNESGALAYLADLLSSPTPIRTGYRSLVVANLVNPGYLDALLPGLPGYHELGDPVLAPGKAGVAFKVAGSTQIHPARPYKAIWWEQGYSSAHPVAELGDEPPGCPGKHWKGFDSLAIMSGRGPLFTAKTEGGEQGVWAMDLDGTLRLLFHAGEKLEGKAVRQFTLLNALPGSTGSTRSFNARGQVAWRAMLGGGEQALVVTQAP